MSFSNIELFPAPHTADEEGLLAIGGDLSAERLIYAYCHGIFPWYNPGDPILWWSPDPRLILVPEKLHVSRRLQRTLRQGRFQITLDKAFERVICDCAATRLSRGEQTWLAPEMINAYTELHRMGLAHSAEAWQDGDLAGGLYGVALGRAFFGESMFSRASNSSKAALVTLVRQLERWGFRLIDCQVTTAHLLRFGAEEIPRDAFLKRLKTAVTLPNRAPRGKWDRVVFKHGKARIRPS